MGMMNSVLDTTTDILWTLTNRAIHAGEWPVAEAGIDRLIAECHQVRDEFIVPRTAPTTTVASIRRWNERCSRRLLSDDEREVLIEALVLAREDGDAAKAERCLAALRGEIEMEAALA